MTDPYCADCGGGRPTDGSIETRAEDVHKRVDSWSSAYGRPPCWRAVRVCAPGSTTGARVASFDPAALLAPSVFASALVACLLLASQSAIFLSGLPLANARLGSFGLRLIAIFSGVGGVILLPIWYIWLGLRLRKAN